MNCDEVPWEKVREIMRQAPQWAAQVDGLSGTGAPPTLGGTGDPAALPDVLVSYLDLKRGLLFLEQPKNPASRCGYTALRCPPKEAPLLTQLVHLQLISPPGRYDLILESLRRLRRHRPRGRAGQYWNEASVHKALLRAYRCICCPHGGCFLSEEEWRGGEGTW